MFSKLLRTISRIILPRAIIIGLDIQDRHLSAVATLRRGDETNVLASGTYELPEDTLKDGELRNPTVLTRTIRTFLEQVPTRRFVNPSEYVFVLSIPPEHVYTETLFLPLMTPQELADAIHLKIETSLPWEASKAYVDFRTLPARDPKQTSTFIAGVAKATLDTYLEAFFSQGWLVGACEFHMLSLAKFVDPEHARSSLLAIIDEDGIELAAFSLGSIVAHYLQTIPAQGDVQKTLQDQVKHLASYVEGSFGITVEHIFIFDKLNKEYALNRIEQETGVPAQIFTPSPHLDPRLFIAFGASLRSYGATERSLNLVPPALGGRYEEHLITKTSKLWSNIFLVFAATFLAVFGGTAAFLWFQGRSLTEEERDFRVTLDQQLTQAGPITEEVRAFNRLATAFTQVVAQRSDFGTTLGLVEQYADQYGLGLRNASLSDQYTFTATFLVPTRDAVLGFQKAVKESGIFSDVSIPLAELAPESNFIVNISFKRR